MISRLTSLWQQFADLPRSTRWLTYAAIGSTAILVGLFLITQRAISTPEPDTAIDGNSAFRPGISTTTIAPTGSQTTAKVAPPPGITTTATTDLATPAADPALGKLAHITDPELWAQTFAVVWNSFAPAGNSHQEWLANVSNYSTGPCQTLLNATGSTAWTGALMARLTVRPTATPRVQQLWTVGDASMWRTTTTIDMVSADPDYRGMDGTATAVWDFYLKKQPSGVYLLDSYAQPAPENTNPRTYSPAR